MKYDMEFLIKGINEALDTLYDNDRYLIINKPADWENYGGDGDSVKDSHVGERAIVFRYAHYLQIAINKEDKLKKLNLDCEYNRCFYDKKTLPGFANGTYPDLILHRRGSNDHNVLVIEFKTWWNPDCENDIAKLKGLTDPTGIYKYLVGASVLLGKRREDCSIKFFNEGNECLEPTCETVGGDRL